MPMGFWRHNSGVRCGGRRRTPGNQGSAGVRAHRAASIRLFLIRLRPRRAELRFAGQPHATKKVGSVSSQGLTRSEVGTNARNRLPFQCGCRCDRRATLPIEVRWEFRSNAAPVRCLPGPADMPTSTSRVSAAAVFMLIYYPLVLIVFNPLLYSIGPTTAPLKRSLDAFQSILAHSSYQQKQLALGDDWQDMRRDLPLLQRKQPCSTRDYCHGIGLGSFPHFSCT